MKKLLTGFLVLALIGCTPQTPQKTTPAKPTAIIPTVVAPKPVKPHKRHKHPVKRDVKRPLDYTKITNQVVELHMEFHPVVEGDEAYASHGTCSGAFIDDHGSIITARHCVKNTVGIEVEDAQGRLYDAEVVKISKNHDLALIRIARQHTPHFKLAKTVKQGQPIFVIGSPLGIGKTLTQGHVGKDAGDQILMDCSVLPGNSGSTVFDKDGNLVGVATAGFIVGFGVTHLNIMQSLDVVADFLRP